MRTVAWLIHGRHGLRVTLEEQQARNAQKLGAQVESLVTLHEANRNATQAANWAREQERAKRMAGAS